MNGQKLDLRKIDAIFLFIVLLVIGITSYNHYQSTSDDRDSTSSSTLILHVDRLILLNPLNY
jgi:hypothetical protein